MVHKVLEVKDQQRVGSGGMLTIPPAVCDILGHSVHCSRTECVQPVWARRLQGVSGRSSKTRAFSRLLKMNGLLVLLKQLIGLDWLVKKKQIFFTGEKEVVIQALVKVCV